MQPLVDAIDQGSRLLDLKLDQATLDQLDEFVRLLAKWTRVYNLTAVREPRAIVTRHILDSLAVVAYLRGRTLLDVGTGAGLPGLPLAMVRPQLEVTLLDASAKKLRFVRQAVAELGLRNVGVARARMREYQPGRAFDMVVSRAVTSLDELYRQSQHLLGPNGRMLFMKGALPEQEMAAFSPGRGALHCASLYVPGLDAERHLVWLDRQG